VSTSDGFRGRGTFSFTGANSIGGNMQIDSQRQSVTLGNETGERVVLHGVATNVRVNGGVTHVDLEKFSLECVGKP
jgi:hypothetical protein